MNSEHTLNPTGGALNRRYMEEPTSSLNLLECILSNDNIKEAWKQVRTNKGAPGIDGITVEEFPYAFRECWSDIRSSILAGKYKQGLISVKEQWVKIHYPATAW